MQVAIVGFRSCTSCKLTKPLESFPNRKNRPLGKSTVCRDCISIRKRNWESGRKETTREQHRAYYLSHKEELNAKGAQRYRDNKKGYYRVTREYRLKRNFGISVEDYDALLLSQNGGCAICGETRSNSASKNLAVDHDHITGKIRGLLCSRCNTLIGKARDSVTFLRECISYLQKHGSVDSWSKKIFREEE